MSEEKGKKEQEELTQEAQENEIAEQENLSSGKEGAQDQETTEESENDELAALQKELQETKDKYLRQYSEFENFRKRTSKEKLDLVSTANEGLILALLPVMDDFERAQQSLESSDDIKALKEGFDLIHSKFQKILDQKGLKPIEAKGESFDPELHEGISQMPVEDEKEKGKVIDEVEKGYYLGEKVIRYSKVVIGS